MFKYLKLIWLILSSPDPPVGSPLSQEEIDYLEARGRIW